MKAPKNRYAQTKPTKRPVLSPPKFARPARIPRSARREIGQLRTKSSFWKYFNRSLLSGLGLLIILVLLTMFSPLLSVDKIVVSGNDKVSTKELSKALKHRLGSALPMVSEADIASDLKDFKLIESIAVVARPPHLLEVKITERTPIAVVIRGGTKYLYDPAGINLGIATGYEKIPTILVTDDPKTSKNYQQAIDVVLALPAQLLDRVAYIQARSRDNVTMQLRGNARQTIIWGDSSDSILKSKVLKTLLLKIGPGVRATFDVSAPLNPSVIR